MAGAFATLAVAAIAWGTFVERRLTRIDERLLWIARQLSELTGNGVPWSE